MRRRRGRSAALRLEPAPQVAGVGATVLALVPVASHGGPLCQPLCHAQIGGLSLATFIELLLVKVFCSTFVRDLGIIRGQAMPAATA